MADGHGADEDHSSWTPRTAKPAVDPIDPLVDEAHYQGLGNMLAGFFVSVGLLAMVVASLWV